MAKGYSQILYRLNGVLIGSPPLDGNVETIREALEAYYLDDALDEVSRELAWYNFCIPSLLISLSGFIDSEAHMIRLNDYMFNHLSEHVPAAKDQRDCVFGAIALLVDIGSATDPEVEIDFLETVLYNLFPGLKEFLRLVEPNQSPFVTRILDLTRLSDYMTSIQVISDKIFSVLIFYLSFWIG